MIARFSIDSEQRKTGSRACAIVHYQIDSEHWFYREEPEAESGRNCTLELSEGNKWRNYKIEGQIKGTKRPKVLSGGDFTYALDIRTIEYALNSKHAFVLFYVDVVHEDVYFLPVQDYFIDNAQLLTKLSGEQETVSVHIPKKNLLKDNDYVLQELARSTYIDVPGIGLRRYTQQRLFTDGFSGDIL